MDGTNRKSVRMWTILSTIKQSDLINFYRTFYPTTAKYTFFPSAQEHHNTYQDKQYFES